MAIDKDKKRIDHIKSCVENAINISGTQSELAKELNVTRQMVCRWLRSGRISLNYFIELNKYIDSNN